MRNFIIVGTQRTGSSALGEAIGLHPDIACGWEWTEHVPRNKKLVLAKLALKGEFDGLQADNRDHIKDIYTSNIGCLGYRRLFGSSNKWLFHPRYSLALWKDRFEEHLQWFRENPEIYIIHLVRRDNVNWLKSKFLARKSKNFIGRPYPEGMKVKIPLREAVARLESKDWVDSQLSNMSSTNPYHRIIYEDFLIDNNLSASEVFKFLNCSLLDMKNEERIIKKQSMGSAADYIVNYDSLINILSKKNLIKSNII